ncbi:MAG: hypothetical protein A2X46_16505 [Lentisphaerae bacterium GWF2_57_35]|nr:MAG: hypothetical protein A2X46_16505 [Lentisphaerae bacterium GWF2_57_35]
MSTPSISVRNLSKCYTLGAIGRHTLVDEVQYWWHKIRGQDPRQHMTKIGHTATEARRAEAEQMGADQFWALNDVSFDIHPGEVVGIIGRNGAGKSTLLKILSRITEPTHGEALINGRVGSLLEVGTGFHPELTGRENVFMNGTILGMNKREIAAKFDEIIAFSELEKFIDTPVKRYSSGMYVRLAFAVAAHLEPEILLIDEVLAVGDVNFQRKCLAKMKEVSEGGRTILFVSHNMGAIANLCTKGVILTQGRVVGCGAATECVKEYLGMTLPSTAYSDFSTEASKDAARFLRCGVCAADGRLKGQFCVDDPIRFFMTVEVLEAVQDAEISVRIEDVFGRIVCTSNWSDQNSGAWADRAGRMTWAMDIPAVFLAPNNYLVTMAIHQPRKRIIDLRERVIKFEVSETGGPMWKYHGNDYGAVLVQWPWRRLEREPC